MHMKHKLQNKVIRDERILNEWKKSTTIPNIKKGQKKTPRYYRGIMLLDIADKRYFGRNKQ